MADIVVYNQKDLDNAIIQNKPVIVLCAGLFVIPKSPDTTFKRIGPVRVVVTCSRISASNANMSFIDIEPDFREDHAISSIASQSPVSVTFGGSYGSGSYLFGSGSYLSGSGSYLSGSGSYLSGSGSYLSGSGGSYRYTYEYEFEISFGRSFTSSFRSSFGSGSAQTVNFSEYTADEPSGTISIHVFGYGINLI